MVDATTVPPSQNGTMSGTDKFRRMAFPVSQVVALVLAIAAGWYGYTIVRDDRLALGESVIWIVVCSLLMAYVAWNGARPHPQRWPRAMLTYVREHPIELGLLAMICALGVFMRLWRYGTLPPSGFVFFEEHIYGGVQWDILQGDRTYIYLMHNYLGALAQSVLGPNTDGLRMHSVIAGIVSVPVVYLMMREVTGRAGALFATGIYASLRSTGDVGPPHQTLFLAEAVMIWTALRALNTGNLVWLVPASLAAAVLSYEYESAKAVPLLLAAFLVWLAVRGLLWPLPRGFGIVWGRVRRNGPRIARGAVVVTVVLVAALGPMVAETKRGKDIYFGSLDRNQADRDGGRFAPDWADQLEASIKSFTPWLEPNFQTVGSIASGGIVDNMSAAWIWAGVLAGIAMFWRGHRALFIGWFLSGIIMSSLLLSNWAAWKMVGWMLPAVALAGLVADDLVALARRYSKQLAYGVMAVLAGAVAVAFTLNTQQLNENSKNPYVLKEWGNNPSYLFSICDNIRERPDDTFGIVSQRQRYTWGFGNDVVTLEDAKKMWGDFRFVCEGQVGMAVANLQEAWPIVVTEDRPYTLIHPASPGEGDQIANALARALPELGEPDERKDSPGNSFELMIYDATREELNARRGLLVEWLDATGTPLGDAVISASFDETPPAGAATYRITGLVSVAEQFNGYLGPVEANPDVTVTVEDQASYAAGAGVSTTIFAGWHIVEISGSAEAGIPARFAWFAADGSVYDVLPDTMFALADQGVWLHLREVQLPDEELPLAVLRYDFEPHATAISGIRIDATTAVPTGTTILRDYYRGYWTLAGPDQFTFQSTTGDQSIEMKIDGETVFYRTPTEGLSHGTKQLAPGEHLVEITYSDPAGAYSGGLVWATSTTTGEVVPIDVRPFPARRP